MREKPHYFEGGLAQFDFRIWWSLWQERGGGRGGRRVPRGWRDSLGDSSEMFVINTKIE